MVMLRPEEHRKLGIEHVTFAKEELERRRQAPVYVSAEEVAAQFKDHYHVYILDPRIGFNQKTFRFWLNRISPGGQEGAAAWKTIGHRHTVEAVIHILQGHGYSVIDGIRYDWEPGDFICVPVFAWHRHVNASDEEMIYVAATTGPFSMYMGIAIYEDESYPEYWVFAQQGEEAMRTLIPGGAEAAASGTPVSAIPHLQESPSPNQETTQGGLHAARLYGEQLRFAEEEEQRRRRGRVQVKGTELAFQWTPMGRVAYVVDPRLGFHVRTLSTLVAEIPPGTHSGAHRHIYEETNYILAGQGYSIIEDCRYDWKQGDTLCIPLFAWHQHFNTSDQAARILVYTSRVAMENLGYMSTQQGEVTNMD